MAIGQADQLRPVSGNVGSQFAIRQPRIGTEGIVTAAGAARSARHASHPAIKRRRAALLAGILENAALVSDLNAEISFGIRVAFGARGAAANSLDLGRLRRR